MKYSIYFYAADGSGLAETLANDASIVERTLAKFRTAGDIPEEDVIAVKHLLVDGLNGNWPQSKFLDAFIAFHWLMETLGEPILVEELIEFRRWQYWTLTGLSHFFEMTKPPFPVPTSPDSLPSVYFLPNSVMQIVLADSNEEPRPHDAQLLREELQEIVASVHTDQLDLIAVALN